MAGLILGKIISILDNAISNNFKVSLLLNGQSLISTLCISFKFSPTNGAKSSTL